MKNGVEAWDIDGPEIYTPDGLRMSRIEVKSAASVQIDTPDEKEPISCPPSRLVFSIRKAINWKGKDEIPRHNNDLYVFCHYTAQRKSDDMLDLKWWDFYVYPTFKIDEDTDTKLSDQKTISLRRLQMIGISKVSFAELYDEIMRCLDEISEHFNKVK